MNTSEELNEFAEALSKAQSQMTGATKDSSNPFFKSRYSDLSSVIAAIGKPFSDNGLCFIQSPEFSGGGVMVTTRIIHKSGQWVESSITMPVSKNDAQAVGSAVTYGKRYGLQSMAGVPSIDDDGNCAAQQPVPNIKQVAKPELTPDNEKEWGKAKEAYRRGEFDLVLKSRTISNDNLEKIKRECV